MYNQLFSVKNCIIIYELFCSRQTYVMMRGFFLTKESDESFLLVVILNSANYIVTLRLDQWENLNHWCRFQDFIE